MHRLADIYGAVIVCGLLVSSATAFFAPFLHESKSSTSEFRAKRDIMPTITPDVLNHAHEHRSRPKNSSTMFMVELFESLYTGHNLLKPSEEECRAIEEADTVRNYIGVVKDVRSSRGLMTWVTSFPTFDQPADEVTHLAELRVELNATSVQSTHRFVIQLHQWVNVSCDEDLIDGSCKQRKLIHSRNIDARHDEFDGREVFDITSIVHQWIAATRNSTTAVEYSIELRAKPLMDPVNDHNNDVLKALIRVDIEDEIVDDLANDDDDIPSSNDDAVFTKPLSVTDVTLVVFSRASSSPIILSDAHGSKRTRTRRSTDEARRRKKQKDLNKHQRDEHKHKIAEKLRLEEENSGPCRRVDMDVDFGRIGWDEWIIYPKQFNAYRCVGTCAGPIDSNDSPSNHAIMQDLVRMHQPERRTPEPCCVPTELRPLSMLYFEQGAVLVRHHEDMIVHGCGCR
uniref:Nodal n=1 Tax=Temnopleurus reevesii TaxID=161071 RepID=A0A2Z5ZA43_9ECHN|nr:Nodal [Temnopleurus reevesii]